VPTRPSAAQPAHLDPLIVEAAKDVDGSLLRWALSLTPRERLRACTRATRALSRFRRVTPEDR
jgi:hypothetical protein